MEAGQPEVSHGIPSSDDQLEIQSGRTAADPLVRNLWWFVYRYLTGRGYSSDKARDLAQGFFADVFLPQQRFKGKTVHGDEPRLRGLVVVALCRYVVRVHRDQAAKKRIPPRVTMKIEVHFRRAAPLSRSPATAEDALDYAGVSTLLKQVLKDVEATCHRDGKTLHWRVFSERVLLPMEGIDPPPSLAALCQKYGIDDAGAASNMIVTVRRSLRRALIQRLRAATDSEEAALEKLREIQGIVHRVSHGSL